VNNLAPISNIGDVRHYSTGDVFNVGTKALQFQAMQEKEMLYDMTWVQNSALEITMNKLLDLIGGFFHLNLNYQSYR
jgi:hypothetical protein